MWPFGVFGIPWYPWGVASFMPFYYPWLSSWYYPWSGIYAAYPWYYRWW